MRPIRVTISQSALRHNLAIVKKYAPYSKVLAVVKANAYGHGLLNAAYGLNAADGFGVLGINEAIDLREAGFEQKILLLEGLFSTEELHVAASYQLEIVVHHSQQLAMLESIVLSYPLHVHIKINTGMNRLGFHPDQFQLVMQRLNANSNVASITLMTHFATADTDAAGVATQLQMFKQITQGIDLPVSLANSAAILHYPETHTNWVRPGIMLYGASPVSGISAQQFGLQPAMQFTTEVIAVQTLKKGESIGYGHRFTASQVMRVGIIACGYADGYPRHAGQMMDDGQVHGSPMMIAGKYTQTIGRVSMDMMFADLTDIPEADIGSSVELWGQHILVDKVAAACGTIGYELLCAIATRVPIQVID